MTTRRDFLDHLDALSDAGHPPVCRTVPVAERVRWTSDDADQQADSATACQPCTALTACHDYGLEHPREAGVYGGHTDSERHTLTKKAS